MITQIATVADSESDLVEIYTDGSCSPNPGAGGWAALLRFRGTERELSGGMAATTNNQMELRAAVEALKALKRPCKVLLSTDSKYVQEGISNWVHGWQKRGWRTADGAPVKNQALWQELIAEAQRHQVQWLWVRAHNGHSENERVDLLAKAALGAAK